MTRSHLHPLEFLSRSRPSDRSTLSVPTVAAVLRKGFQVHASWVAPQDHDALWGRQTATDAWYEYGCVIYGGQFDIRTIGEG